MSTLTLDPTPTTTARPRPRPRVATYALLDLKRQVLRDRLGMFFVVGLPAFMYLVFGFGSDDPAGSGNVAMYVMISMAAYGAVTATTSVAGTAATEQKMGWGRQMGLTPVRPLQFVLAKTAVAMAVAAVPITLIYGIGALTGARGDASDWLLSAAIVWLGSAVFAVYGLAMCLVFKGENAAAVASGLIVVMAFVGNIFSPLSGTLLEIGRFTPLYGYAGLAHFPLTDGHLPMDAGRDSIPLLLANVGAWLAIFTLLAMWGVRRRRARV